MKTKLTVELTTEELIRALEKGTLKGRKIKNVKWKIKQDVWYQNGMPQYETVVTGVTLETEA